MRLSGICKPLSRAKSRSQNRKKATHLILAMAKPGSGMAVFKEVGMILAISCSSRLNFSHIRRLPSYQHQIDEWAVDHWRLRLMASVWAVVVKGSGSCGGGERGGVQSAGSRGLFPGWVARFQDGIIIISHLWKRGRRSPRSQARRTVAWNPIYAGPRISRMLLSILSLCCWYDLYK